MKKNQIIILALAAVMAFPLLTKAQNIQIHRDFGHLLYDEQETRQHWTSTVEMFRPDSYGSSYFFVDMDYADNKVRSAYWEVSRNIRLGEKTPWHAHVEYNGGTATGFAIPSAWLAGAMYEYNNKDFSAGWSLTAMYKYLESGAKRHSAQLTGTWYSNFNDGLYTFSGFFDIWGDCAKPAGSKRYMVFLSEPQFWINLNAIDSFPDDFNLSIGGEVELSYNFPYENKKFFALPTMAVKWTF